MAVSNTKLRTLYVMKMLLEYSDEEHALSSADIIKKLESYGLSGDRKSIYGDIETLEAFGFDIMRLNGGANPGYYLASRDFELPELKLLVDAVQSSKFITAKKSHELIKKIETLASVHESKQLKRQLFIYDRPKTGNETIYYNVDRIQEGLMNDTKIKFHYMEWNTKKELVPRKNGEYYVVSPWAMTWDDENYYMVAYSDSSDHLNHYRVDKMKDVEVIADEPRSGKEKFEKFNLAAFAKKTFGMYGGEDRDVSLICENRLVGVMIDRFGRDITVIQEDDDHIKVTVPVTVSQQFFGWLTGLGTGVKIAAPADVRDAYRDYVKDIFDGLTNSNN